MCYHIAQKSPKKTLEKKFNALFPDGLNWENPTPKINGFGHPSLPVIKADSAKSFSLLQWGLIPFFIKNEEEAGKIRTMTLNAKSETIFEKPSFRSSIMKKRCIIPVDGFFEWRTDGKKKIPHYIYLKNNEPFALGGIYDNWVNKSTGEVRETFSIITTEANPMMAEIHNTKQRMPLILEERNIGLWLNQDTPKDLITQMMIPFDQELMQADCI